MGLRFTKDDGEEFQATEFVKLLNVAPLQRGFDLPESQREEGVYPIVCSNGIIGYDAKYKCEGYAVVTGRSGTIGSFTYLDYCRYWPHNTSLWVTNFYGNDPKFVYYLYNTINIKRFSTGSGVPTLNRNNVHEHKVKLPCLEEQLKIASFLTSVDEVISASEDEVKNLEEQKKGMMQKLFSQEVRFMKDDGSEYPEWKLLRMGEITTSFQKRNKDKLPLDIYSISNVNGFVPQSEQFEDAGYLKNSDTSIYMIVPPKHFAYNPARINIGSIGYQALDHDVQVSSLYEVFGTSELISDEFLMYWFRTNYFFEMVRKYSEGGVRAYYYYDKLCETKIHLPCLEEQQKIVSFLSSFDDAITAAKEELKCWKDIKKGLLQQLFEQEEE